LFGKRRLLRRLRFLVAPHFLLLGWEMLIPLALIAKTGGV
jgi:hypothetical protein